MMKVQGTLKDTEFGELKCGDAFVHEGKPYMKVQHISTSDNDNAVHLGTGHTRMLESGIKVIAKPSASIDLDK